MFLCNYAAKKSHTNLVTFVTDKHYVVREIEKRISSLGGNMENISTAAFNQQEFHFNDIVIVDNFAYLPWKNEKTFRNAIVGKHVIIASSLPEEPKGLFVDMIQDSSNGFKKIFLTRDMKFYEYEDTTLATKNWYQSLGDET